MGLSSGVNLRRSHWGLTVSRQGALYKNTNQCYMSNGLKNLRAHLSHLLETVLDRQESPEKLVQGQSYLYARYARAFLKKSKVEK